MQDCAQKDTIWSLMRIFSSQNRYLVVCYMFLMILIPVEQIGIPHFVGILYEQIKTKKPIFLTLVISMCLMVGFQVMHILGDYIEVQMYPKLQKFFREYMMIKVVDLISYNFKEIDAGDFLTKVVQIPAVAFNHVYEYIGKIIPNFLTLVSIIIYLCIYADLVMGLILGGMMLCMFAIIRKTIKACTSLSRERIQNYYKVYSSVDDTLHNIKTVMTYDQLRNELERIDIHHQKYADLSNQVFHCGVNAKYICLPLLISYAVFFLAVLFNRMQNNALESGTFIGIAIMISFVVNAAVTVLDSVKELITRQGILDNSFKIFQTCNVPRIPYNMPPRSESYIQIQDLTFSYDNNTLLFDKFNMSIEKNQTVVIFGHIGSGKSTLISVLMKLQSPQDGDIFIDGIAYSGLSFAQVRSLIGYLPQNPILLDRSVLENILFGLNGIERTDVEDMIKRMHLIAFISQFPKGLDTLVGKYGSMISGGQRQIMWIMKIILLNPDIVILDEPTAAIDKDTKEIVDVLLKDLFSRKTCIIVTHDSYLAKFADRIITISHGKIIEDSF